MSEAAGRGISASLIPIPEDFHCPISKEPFVDPVCTCDGQTYERQAIEEWFRIRRRNPETRILEPPRSPLTNAVLATTDVTPNVALRNAIQAFMELRPDLRVEPARLDLCDMKAIVEEFMAEAESKRRTWEERCKAAEDKAKRLLEENIELQAQNAELLRSLGSSPDASVSEEAQAAVLPRVQEVVRPHRRELDHTVGRNEESGLANAGVLKPSLKASAYQKANRREGDLKTELDAVEQLQDLELGVVCICFGQEKHDRLYILLAVGGKHGDVVIYRCYRTDMEMSLLQGHEFPNNDPIQNPGRIPDSGSVVVHLRLVGHRRAITSLVFVGTQEEELVTTSVDATMRLWSVESGVTLKEFVDGATITVARALPWEPQLFVSANIKRYLKVVNRSDGTVLSRIKVEHTVHSLTFADTGQVMFAGTDSGSVYVFEKNGSVQLKLKLEIRIEAQVGHPSTWSLSLCSRRRPPGPPPVISSLVFVPAAHEKPPCLLSSSSNGVTIFDCIYGSRSPDGPGSLTSLTVRHSVQRRVGEQTALLPLECCYSPSGSGYLISGSEGKNICIYSMDKNMKYKMQHLTYQQHTVVTVATNNQDTLLASGDSLGSIVLWRRLDFS